MMTSFPLLLLPAEIRLQVYAHLLVPPAAIPLRSLLGGHRPSSKSHQQRIHPNIIFASRQTHTEALPIFWRQNAFLLDDRAIRILLEPDLMAASRLGWREWETQAALRVRARLSGVRKFRYHASCELVTHQPVLAKSEACVHLEFPALAELRDVVALFYMDDAEGEAGRKLEIVLDVESYQGQYARLLVDFDHGLLKKLNYRTGNPPWGEGDTIDVVASNLRGFGKGHAVELSLQVLDRFFVGSEEEFEQRQLTRTALTTRLVQNMRQRFGYNETIGEVIAL